MIVLAVLLDIYALAVFLRLVLTWMVPPRSGLMATGARAVCAVTEPPLSAIRTVVRPVRFGSTLFDLSPVLLLLALWLVASLVYD
jgi:YggT family protein